ncbi:cathepsin L1 [Tetranychus urticae]|uniref:Peptidase C1A papain C-terminal domain-containing protein n=1 Tax=Tetranychus urticae TaxID=32264 RepID=T1KF34_TETUR|nr:cathepsin L1 [Tetranychus urticae]
MIYLIFPFILLSLHLSPIQSIELSENELDSYWTTYKVRHGKNYTFSADDYFRKYAFGMNLNKILKHNTVADLGLRNFKLSLNRYADKTTGEMVKQRTGLSSTSLKSAQLKLFKPRLTDANVTSDKGSSFDWRSHGIVNPPVDQGECGSCWAFATTSTIEGQWALKTGQLVNASAQQLIDCSWSNGNEGCGGGNMLGAYTYLADEPFVDATDYPYLTKDYVCLDQQIKLKYGKIRTIGFVTPLDETELALAVKEIGPIAVAIDGSSPYLTFYWEGIYDDDTCTNQVNHAVTLVGFGTDSNGIDYWIVKNSWGADWGDNGYFKMRRGVNMCGVAEMPMYANF